jgi:hypothetical protein
MSHMHADGEECRMRQNVFLSKYLLGHTILIPTRVQTKSITMYYCILIAPVPLYTGQRIIKQHYNQMYNTITSFTTEFMYMHAIRVYNDSPNLTPVAKCAKSATMVALPK